MLLEHFERSFKDLKGWQTRLPDSSKLYVDFHENSLYKYIPVKKWWLLFPPTIQFEQNATVFSVPPIFPVVLLQFSGEEKFTNRTGSNTVMAFVCVWFWLCLSRQPPTLLISRGCLLWKWTCSSEAKGGAVPCLIAACRLYCWVPACFYLVPAFWQSMVAQFLRVTVSVQARTTVNHILKMFYKPECQMGNMHTGCIVRTWL